MHVIHDNRSTGNKAAAASLSVDQSFLDASIWAKQGMSFMGWVHEVQCMLQELWVSWQCRERIVVVLHDVQCVCPKAILRTSLVQSNAALSKEVKQFAFHGTRRSAASASAQCRSTAK